jgi:hypothetical protein
LVVVVDRLPVWIDPRAVTSGDTAADPNDRPVSFRHTLVSPNLRDASIDATPKGDYGNR